MNIQPFRMLIAWAFIGAAGLAMVTTLRGNALSGPMIPALVPVLGYVFAGLFVALQVACCLMLRAPVGLAWVVGVCVAGFLAGTLGQSAFGDDGYDWTRHRVVAGACLSAIVLGVLVLKNKLPMRED